MHKKYNNELLKDKIHLSEINAAEMAKWKSKPY